METINNCPVCGSENKKTFIKCKDYTVSNETYSISICENCEFLFTNPRPTQNEIGKFYQSEDYISHSNSKKGLFNKLYQVVRNRTISQKLKLINHYVSRGTLLDIGCGTGEFLNYCNNNGWAVTGIEPSINAREFSSKHYSLKTHDEDYIKSLPDASFDIISMWHVLEHVHELNQRLVDLKRLLKPDGVIVIAVPNCTSFDAETYKEFWAAYDLPRHLYHFKPKTIQKLFDKFNLNCVSIKPMTFDSFYVSMLSEKYMTGKIKYLRAFIIGLKSNIRAFNKRDNSFSSQIYIFKKS